MLEDLFLLSSSHTIVFPSRFSSLLPIGPSYLPTKALQLTPDTDSTWEKVQYQDWRDKITVIVLSAVQKVAIAGIKSDNPLHWIYTPKLVDPTKTVRKQDDNIEGLQYLHPLLAPPDST